jgi:serine/threonine-protein kinase
LNPSYPHPGVRPGDILAGKYRVERVLGQGGMGVVVAAHHMQLDEKVALKFLLPETLQNPEAVGRFTREARAAVKIKSEHVARVSDVGQLENGSPYMVMEYLEGSDLADWLKQRGPLAVEQAVDFVLQACEAIAEAHALGIVHRDLKPANLFCIRRADGQLSIKVLDFGISKVTTPGAAGHDLTSTAAIVGSPYYMSPEQLQASKGVDTRTDVWALGVILFELLSGRVPIDAEAVTELIIRIVTVPPPPIRALRPDVPEGLERAIGTCLEKNRERRFASVGELAIALRDFGSREARGSVVRILRTLHVAGISASGEYDSLGRTATASGLPMPGMPPVPVVPNTQATWGRTGPTTSSPSSRLGVWVGAVLALVLAASAGGVLFWRSRGHSAAAGVAPSATPSGLPPVAAIANTAPSATAAPAETMMQEPAPTMGASAMAGEPPAAPVTTGTHHRRGAPPPAAPSSAASPAPAPPPPSAAPSPADCDPPYTLDDRGNKHFKPECYLQK